MYLYIRTWALIDTGKYLTTIYMVYLYLCSIQMEKQITVDNKKPSHYIDNTCGIFNKNKTKLGTSLQ